MRGQGKVAGRLRAAVWAVILALMPVTTVAAGDTGWPPADPMPRLETGMHTAIIRRIGVDAGERFLVTASDDKTARVWDLKSGALLQVLRVPIGQDPNEGMLYAAAISPDGDRVAAAGWTRTGSNDIYIFDRESGRLLETLGGLPNVILHLTFSRDGRYLAATLAQKSGLSVFDTRNWSLAAQDQDYGGDSLWADFDGRGRLVTTCNDGYLRLYNETFTLIAKRAAPGGRMPFSACFSPDGRLLAVGFDNSTGLNVLSAEDLSWRYNPNTDGVDNGDLATIKWSRDGQRLYAGGEFADRRRNNIKPVLRWNRAGQGPATRLAAATNTIMDLWPLQDGRLAYGAGGPDWGVLHPDGRREPVGLPETVDFRDQYHELLVSRNGMTVQFGYGYQGENLSWQRHRARLDLVRRHLTLDPAGAAEATDLRPPDTAGAKYEDWLMTYEPRWQGRDLKLKPLERSQSLAAAPAGRLVLGTEWSIYCFGPDGRQMWRTAVAGAAWAVNVSGDGRVAVATLADGSIRWYSMADGRELLAFFLHRDGRWVLWCPEGFFDASPGGEKLLGYHLNQGDKGTPEFISMDRVYDLFYRPDLVGWRLEGRPEPEIRTALSRFGDIRQVLGGGLPPAVTLVNTAPVVKQQERNFTVAVDLEDRGGGIGKVVYRLDGVTQETLLARPVDLAGQRGRITRPFTGKPGANKVEVVVYNKDNTVASEPVSFTVMVEQPGSRPALYGLAVGITKYRDHSLELKYAASDAAAFAAELQKRGEGLFKQVQVQALLDKEATTVGISQAFARLAQVIRPEDVFVLFMAGHGFTLEDGRYYFVPQEVRYVNKEALQQGSLDQDKLRGLLETVKARKSLVLLDTCNAGVFASLPARGLQEKTALDRLMQATGRATLASSADRQLALEGYEGHGVFTHVLLQGLKGKMDGRHVGGQRHIYISDLAKFTEEMVPRLSLEKWHYEQIPMKNLQGSDFPIAVVK